ncbi:MAG: DUF1651 domain-containing protein [Cyanobacteriota bacterium]
MSSGPGNRPPLSPREGWIGDGRQALHFRPVRYSRWSQALEVKLGELMASGDPPLLKRRKKLTREQAIKLWTQKRQDGWTVCPPHWNQSPELRPPAPRQPASMGTPGLPPCF